MPYGSRGVMLRGGNRVVAAHPSQTAAGSSILGGIGSALGGFASSAGFGAPFGLQTLPPDQVARLTGGGGGTAVGGYRRRRMNPCNIRALRRAIRRAKSFEKIALKSIRLVSPHRLKGKHRGGFKKARGRSR